MSFRSAFTSAFSSAFRSSYNADVGGNLWLLDQYSDAAAAYSLRRLSAGVSKVVRVRRESDNNERDFTANEVSNGTLQNWTNAQVTPPLDLRELTATGRDGPIIEAAAAYSLRNLSDSYTGSVVDVRRSSDGNTETFTAAEVTDGTLVAWVLGDAASLVGNAQYFNGTSSEVTTTGLASAIGTQDFKVSFSLGGVATPGRIVQMGDAQSSTAKNGFFISLSSSGTFTIGVDETFSTLTTVRKANGGSYDVVFDRSGDAEIFEDGVSIGTVDISSKSGTSLLNKPLFIGARDVTSNPLRMSGVIYNISIDIGNDGTSNNSYTGLGATPWSDTIGSNNGTPSNLATFTGQGLDGTVSKWYDQSTTSDVPNANHAVQTSVARQPKIVSSGVYLGYLTKNAAESGFNSGISLPLTGSFSLFYRTDFSATSCVLGGDGSIPRLRHLSNQVEVVNNLGTEVNFSQTSIGEADAVYSLIRDSSNDINFHKNGALITGSPLNLSSSFSFSHLAMRTLDKDGIEGQFYEIIVYNTDQTDNRTALEANIGEVYGIAGIPAYDNTVNGFVETWYDQSGNGNNATQLTAGNQPKIVDGGTLVTGGLDFSGDFLVASSLSGLTGSISMLSVSERDFTGNVVSLSSSSSGGRYFSIQEGGASSNVNIRNPTTVGVSDNVSGSTRLTFALTTGATSTSVGANGSAVTTTSNDYGDDFSGTDIDQIAIGLLRTVSPTAYFDGRIRELIIYDSDQSANRPAIEANINNQYDIY